VIIDIYSVCIRSKWNNKNIYHRTHTHTHNHNHNQIQIQIQIQTIKTKRKSNNERMYTEIYWNSSECLTIFFEVLYVVLELSPIDSVM
jgi:hypothetical protein